MELTFHRVDLAAAADRGQSPTDMLRRERAADVWYVPFSPLRFDQAADWRFYRRNDSVVIPLYPYLVPASPTDALGFMFQLGVNATQQLGGKPVRRLHLAIGEPVNQVYEQSTGQTTWSFHLGVGVLFD